MHIENEKLKLKLIETQMALVDTQRSLLQYQHRDVSANIEALAAAQNDSATRPEASS